MEELEPLAKLSMDGTMTSKSPQKSCSEYTSIPFKFVVQGTTFFVHTDLISRCSSPLDRMMNGGMAEALKGVAVLKEVEASTFARFSEWIYRGQHTPAAVVDRKSGKPRSKKSQTKEADHGENEDTLDFDGYPKHSKKSKKKPQYDPFAGMKKCPGSPSSKNELQHAFIHHRPPLVRQESQPILCSKRNKSAKENFTGAFLSHAQMYVFAERYDIQELKALALENLHQTLAIFNLFEEGTGDITTLLQYVYLNTSQSDGHEESLRSLMKAYVQIEAKTLMKDRDLQEVIINDGGDLLSDFMSAARDRIRDGDFSD